MSVRRERAGTGLSVQFPVDLELLLGVESFVADDVGREDSLKGHDERAVVEAKVETEIPVLYVDAAGVVSADATHLEQVRVLPTEIGTVLPGFLSPSRWLRL